MKQRQKQSQRLRAERAAAAAAAKKRAERRRQIVTGAGVVLVVALVVAGGFVIHSMRDDGGRNDASVTAADVPAPGSTYGLTIGPATAPHQVVVYEDFLCSACGAFEAASHDQLAQLAGQGKVQVEYRPVVLLAKDGEYSARAALIWTLVKQKYGDEAAGKLHDLLFASVPSEQGPFPTREDLYGLAVQAGGNADELAKAVDAQQGVDDVADATKEATAVGIKSTPTVILDGKPFTSGADAGDLAANLVKAVQ